MKKMIFAAFIGMIAFQSCKKENINPAKPVAVRIHQAAPEYLTETDQEFTKCATIVPQPGIPKNQGTPPIVIFNSAQQ